MWDVDKAMHIEMASFYGRGVGQRKGISKRLREEDVRREMYRDLEAKKERVSSYQ